MWSKLLQDWAQFGGSAGTQVQGESAWLETEDVQDLGCLIEVRYANATRIYLTLETAPRRDDSLFQPMQQSDSLDLVPLVGGSAVQLCIAGSTLGPPVSSFVRWKLTTTGNWTACFRLTVFAI